uniref:Uncharacterized protein n=1 Tax=Anguilla anguilla TaxID=7936 RepID=A0A0E9T6R4_ANGAN
MSWSKQCQNNINKILHCHVAKVQRSLKIFDLDFILA